MPSAKVAEAPHLRDGIDRTGHNPFETIPRLHLERVEHGMRRFSDGDYKNAVIRIEVMQVFADAEHAAIAIHMTLERPIDACVSERVLEQMTRCHPHVQVKLLAIGRG